MNISRRDLIKVGAGVGLATATATSKPHHASDNMTALPGRLPGPELRHEMERFIDPLL
jgi:hypothetical protein